MLYLTWRDLRHRAVATTVVAAVVGLVLTLLFLMTGLVHQLQREPHDAAAAIGAPSWVVRSGVSGPFTAVSTLPAGLAAQVGPDATEAVLGRATLRLADGSTTEIVLFGHERGRLGQPPIANGRAVERDDELVVDESLDLPAGADVTIGDRTLRVVGHSRGTTVLAGLPLAFVDLGVAQDTIYGNRSSISMVLAPGPVAQPPEGTTVLTPAAVGDDTLGPIESAVASIDLIRVLLWCVAAIVVGAVAYLGVVERSRELAVLKAVGSSNRVLAAGLTAGAVTTAVAALTLASVAATLIEPVFPLPVRVPATAYVQIPVVMIVVAVVVCLAATRRLTAIDPATAFGGPR